ncbi:class I SAM-dependent methyltransferase [Nonomuraea helvata]|uniref:Class I SAM-dependent methyltransferase n=1 Tax=Nonomuraea helvata TaxID=37484 RepID=A0ABV5RUY1_9ACTN
MSLSEIGKDWTELGKSDPLWAVLTEPGRRHGKWSDAEFLATGIIQVNDDLDWLEGHGISVPRGRALDFGCGAGRLTNALAKHFSEVVGVDISEPMLQEARRLDRSGGRVRFVHRTAPNLACFDNDSYDLVYTDRVLQHLPPDLARDYLRELLRIARPDGAVVVGIPDKAKNSLVGLGARAIPQSVLSLIQRMVLRYPAPMRMHPIPQHEVQAIAAAHGGLLRGTKEYGSDAIWRHVRHIILMNGVEETSVPSGGLTHLLEPINAHHPR